MKMIAKILAALRANIFHNKFGIYYGKCLTAPALCVCLIPESYNARRNGLSAPSGSTCAGRTAWIARPQTPSAGAPPASLRRYMDGAVVHVPGSSLSLGVQKVAFHGRRESLCPWAEGAHPKGGA
jgi:hypothetical protein